MYSSKTLSQKRNKGWRCSPKIEDLPSLCRALGLIPSTEKQVKFKDLSSLGRKKSYLHVMWQELPLMSAHIWHPSLSLLRVERLLRLKSCKPGWWLLKPRSHLLKTHRLFKYLGNCSQWQRGEKNVVMSLINTLWLSLPFISQVALSRKHPPRALLSLLLLM